MGDSEFIVYNIKVPKNIWSDFKRTMTKEDKINEMIIILIEDKIKKSRGIK